MYFDISGEVESDSYAFAFDGCDAYDADGVLRIADDDLFAFSSCDHQHPLLQTSCAAIVGRCVLCEYITEKVFGKGNCRKVCVGGELRRFCVALRSWMRCGAVRGGAVFVEF